MASSDELDISRSNTLRSRRAWAAPSPWDCTGEVMESIGGSDTFVNIAGGLERSDESVSLVTDVGTVAVEEAKLIDLGLRDSGESTLVP